MQLIVDTPWIEARGRATPQREALRVGSCRVDYAELLDAARGRAAWLQRRGVEPGSRVATLLRGGREFVELLHAVDLCSATIVPLNWRRPDSELRREIEDSGPRLLVHEDGEFAVRARDVWPDGPRHLVATEEPRAHRRTSCPGSTPFAILYTSGTTGPPKGVVLTRGNFAASAAASCEHLGVDPDDRWLACMPLFHVGGLSILTRSAIAGTSVVSHPGFDVEEVSKALDHDAITMVSLVPTMLQRLLDHRGAKPAPPQLRVLLLGGAPASEELLERALAAGYPLAPTYGLTEATSQVATRRPGDRRRPLCAHLEPLPRIEVQIRDADGRELAAGQGGEIWLRGPTLSPGSPRAVSEIGDEEGRGTWKRTGDLGRLASDNSLAVLGRSDDMIVSGGENVHPAEVEQVLLAHPEVADVAVAGIPDREYGARPVAWVVTRSESFPGEDELERHCRGSLAGYQVPVSFVRVSHLPRSEAGKVLRRQLVAGFDSRATGSRI